MHLGRHLRDASRCMYQELFGTGHLMDYIPLIVNH